MTFIQVWRFITLMMTAFSLSLSIAHLLEIPAIRDFDQQLFIRVQVIEDLYEHFHTWGATSESIAVLASPVLAFLVRKRGSSFYWTLGGAVLLVMTIVPWVLFIRPMGFEFEKWVTNSVPADWIQYRNKNDYAQILNAFLKTLALSFLVISVLVETPKKRAIDSDSHVGKRKTYSY